MVRFWLLLIIHAATIAAGSHGNYYNASAIQFLKDYGHHYRLFDRFFTDKVLKAFSANVDNDSTKVDISEEYLTKDYSKYQFWGASANIPPDLLNSNSPYENQIDSHTSNQMYQELYHLKINASSNPWDGIDIQANNKFRYGTKYHERFLSIFFHKDPWIHDDATVNFVGQGTSFDSKIDHFICQFYYPVVGQMQAVVQDHLLDGNSVVVGLGPDNNIFCPIPAEIITKLRSEQSVTNGKDDITRIELTFSRVNSDASISPLLANITIPRPLSIDQRQHDIAMVTHVDDYNDPMIVEWMIFHILQGVDHFYLFNNKKTIDADFYSHATLIKPFLDANILTLISYPYYHDIHTTIFQTFIQQYGHNFKWFGTNDIDEFFFPKIELLTLNGCAVKGKEDVSVYTGETNLLLSYFKHLGGVDERVPGIMFDSQEMGCHDKDNHYKSPIAYSARKAVTTHCTIAGKTFKELQESHGKMFMRPSKVPYLASPHRYNDYWIIWTTPATAGTFRHFDSFRYTKKDSNFKEHHYNYEDHSLKHFTMHLLETCHDFKFVLDTSTV